MGRTILTIAGTAVGYYFGGPLGAWAGSIAGAWVGGLLFPEDDTSSYGPRLKDLQIQSSAYGNPIAKVYGTCRVAGNLIWTAGVTEWSRTEEQGGKGGGPTSSTTTYWYTATFAIGICKGPMDFLLRIWADGNLIYDGRSGGVVQESGLSFVFYTGDESQLADPTIESVEGTGETPANRGLCYIVFTDFPISDYGNRIPNLNFEVAEEITETYPVSTFDTTASIFSLGNISLSSDGIYAYHFSADWMTRLNLASGAIDIVSQEFADPSVWSIRIDMDERNYIYTMGGGVGGNVYIQQRDPYGVTIYNSPSTYYVAEFLSVSRSALYPYLVSGGGDYSRQLKVFNRDSLVPLLAVDVQTLTGKNISAHSATWDDENGVCWVLCCSDAFHPDAFSYLIKITIDPYPGVGVSTTVLDITANVGAEASGIGIDKSSGLLFIQGSGTENHIHMYDPDTTVWTDVVGTASADSLTRIYGNRLFAFTGGNTYNLVNTLGGTVINTYSFNDWYVASSLTPVYNVQSNSVISWFYSPAYIFQRYLDRGTPGLVTLASIVQNICEQVGLVNTTDFDVTALIPTLVRGYVIDSRMAARRAIEPLQQTFFFDGVESEGILKFVMRGGASVVTIDDDDMSARGENESVVDPIITTHIQELELPYQVDLEYMDVDEDYEIGSQRGRRLSTLSKELRTTSVAIVLNKDEARQVAEKTIQMIWKERDRYIFQLGRKYWYLDSVDVITLTIGTTTYICRITKEGLGLSGVMKVEAVREDSAIYINTAVGAGSEFDRPTGISWEGPTSVILMDIPAVRDAEAQNSPAGFYVAATGYLSAWRGSTLYKSSDGGITYVAAISPVNEATIGIVIGTPLPTIADPNVWDRTNTLTIRLLTPGATLSSVSELNVLNSSNAAVVGDEIIQFATATLNGDGTYSLSNLLRGRRGTEYAIGTHIAGEDFTLLNASNIYRYEMESSEVDLARVYRAVSLGESFTTGVDESFTNTAKSGHPLSVVHIKGTRDVSNNLVITWIRRTRINGSWRDLVDVDLGEASEAYEVDIYDNGNIVRTIEVTAQTASYTAAQQTTDGLTPGDLVHIKIYQISEAFGRGFESNAII